MHTIGRGALAASLTLAAVALGTAAARAQLFQPHGGGIGQQYFPTAGNRVMTMYNGQAIPSFQSLNANRNPYLIPGSSLPPWATNQNVFNPMNSQLMTPPFNYNSMYYPGPYYPGPINPTPYNPFAYNPYNQNLFAPNYPMFNPNLPIGPYNPGFNPYAWPRNNNGLLSPFGGF